MKTIWTSSRTALAMSEARKFSTVDRYIVPNSVA
jgi:hypothetical protein